VCVAVEAARFGPWNQDVAMVPATLVTAVREQGWLALLITPDARLASEPEELSALLDGLIVPDWAAQPDAHGELVRRLSQGAEARGLPVVRLAEGPDATVAEYREAIGELFSRSAPARPA
jgi:hypothetical protein